MASFTDHTHKTPKHWGRRATFTAGGLIISFLGFIQGEFSATQRVAETLGRTAPHAITVIRTACPQQDATNLSFDCAYLSPFLALAGESK